MRDKDGWLMVQRSKRFDGMWDFTGGPANQDGWIDLGNGGGQENGETVR